MHAKSTILLALTIVSLASARAIASTVEVDNNNDDNNNNEEEEEILESERPESSAPDPVIALTSAAPDCASAASSQTDLTSGSTDQTRLGSAIKAILDRMDDNKRMNIGRRINLDKIRNGIMARANSHSSGSLWQILDDLDILRPNGEGREGLASIVSSLIDPLTIPPQMQYVDNTLRLMAIKNSMDDLLAKFFPNLHMIQHPTEQNNNK